jgi:hypothetical protein
MPRFLRTRPIREDSPFVLTGDRLAGIVTQSRTDGAAVIDSFQLRQNHLRGTAAAEAKPAVFGTSAEPAAIRAA